ncbi:hypothetical protein D3C74_398250 [compost metagenome]
MIGNRLDRQIMAGMIAHHFMHLLDYIALGILVTFRKLLLQLAEHIERPVLQPVIRDDNVLCKQRIQRILVDL